MIARLSAAAALLTLAIFSANAEPDYKITNISAPEGVVLEVGGMDWMPDGSLMMCTRRGEVWNYHPETEKWTLFASGLHEPLGLLAGDAEGEIYVLQRPELSRITDTNGDGVAEKFELFGDGWGYTGNYHEYAFGLVRDDEGSFYGSLGLGFFPKMKPFEPQWCSHGNVPWRGWLFKITKDGEYVPLNPGCREPNSVGRSPNGEIFVTDNQGSYVPCGVLNHAEPGAFLGHPDGLLFDERHPDAASYTIEKLNELRKRPALYLPYREMGASCTAPTWDTTEGKFGPFAGDVLIGDINTPMINRGSLELVDGQYQGAAYHFINDGELGGGSNRLLFDPKGRLWVGQTARGWANGHGLKVVEWSGESKLNYEEISLTKTGFRVTWTQPVDPDTITKLKLTSWICEYTKNYGSGRLEKRDHPIASAKLAEDGRTVDLVVEGLEADRLVQFENQGVKSAAAEDVQFGKAWYTLNRLR
ncbi:MAG: hypothetical protein ACI8UO_001753 [Verrucomicrobiales bacterium]|jgi:hypothetical protein